MFESVLVANRGEIAIRVFRTCAAHGIRTIAIYTKADASAVHVDAADTAVEVVSYLDAQDVLRAARESGAAAVHPGYGFLSENARFARDVDEAGVVWIGPTPSSMEAMARKDRARDIAERAGVPVVPRDAGAFPVLVKAASGGGGKGMRIVRSADELDEARAAAAREALAAFGDDTLLLEKYVERGRHIEVQVFGDMFGTAVAIGDRDCSTQRRHQKVVEEAPAPTLTAAQRRLTHDSAVALARQVGYIGAGTVEFLLDEADGAVYFLEMNTRLQVEHPVTEAVSGLDLVELQLRVAAGERLQIPSVEPKGHSIEARIYAEDPYAGFLPQAGRLGDVHFPSGYGIRVDSGVRSGSNVTTSYDPMLAKIIATGNTREEARKRLIGALSSTAVFGVQSNVGFVRRLLESDEFRDTLIDTAWLDRNPPVAPDDRAARQLAARRVAAVDLVDHGPFVSDGFRLAGSHAPVSVPLEGDVILTLDVIDGRTRLRGDNVEVVHAGQRYSFDRPSSRRALAASAGDGTILSPMPGTVLDVRAAEGDVVEEGQILGVVEAMKMELALRAPSGGVVSTVAAQAGNQVALGALLFIVDPTEAN